MANKELDEPAFTWRDATVVIVGLGLMGGSLALALRARNACRSILGVTRDPRTRERALDHGVVDQASASLDLVAEANVIVLAAPVRTIIRQLALVGPLARPGTVIIDLGSTKREIVAAMERLPEGLEPIGAHPMCGKESSGFAASAVDLYEGAPFVLTPLPRTSPATLELAQSLATTLHARPIVLDAERHDRIVGAISHLPFLLAATLTALAGEHAAADPLLFALAAGGFRDTSRLAASDTTMMLDILLTNGDNAVDLLRAYAVRLGDLADLVANRDEERLRAALAAAADTRRALVFKNERRD